MAVHRDPAADRHPPGRQLTPIGTPDDPALELRRVVSRLAARAGRAPAPAGQVAHPEQAGHGGGQAPAELVRAELRWLADEAAAAEGRACPPVPVLSEHALADQITVLVNDMAAAAPHRAHEVAARLAALRRALP